MIPYEMEGEYVVSFDKVISGKVAGIYEKDSSPVFVRKDSLQPEFGQVWGCRLFESDNVHGHCYYALLLDRAEGELAEETVMEPEEETVEEEAVVEPEPEEVPSEIDDPEEEFVITEDTDDTGLSFLLNGLKCRLSKCVQYIGDNTLSTDLIENGFFIVYMCPDRSGVEIIPVRHGDVVCDNGMIRMSGLDEVLSGHEGCVLPYSWKGNVLRVSLEPI